MKKRIILGALLAIVVFLVPRVSQARWMNVNSGRFQTMDSYEGGRQDPKNLHRYTYASDNPVGLKDPRGKDPEFTAAGQLTGFTINDVIEGIEVPSLNLARARAFAAIGAAAFTIAATLTGDEETSDPNVMRLQLQEGTDKHYWSAPITARSSIGVTRLQVQTYLGLMFTALQLKEGLQDDWDEFNLSRNETQLRTAIIEMSIWVGAHGPTENKFYTVHQEYLDPTDESGPRIDLENVKGINLRQ